MDPPATSRGFGCANHSHRKHPLCHGRLAWRGAAFLPRDSPPAAAASRVDRIVHQSVHWIECSRGVFPLAPGAGKPALHTTAGRDRRENSPARRLPRPFCDASEMGRTDGRETPMTHKIFVTGLMAIATTLVLAAAPLSY